MSEEKMCGACLLLRYKTIDNKDDDCNKCLAEKERVKKKEAN